MVTDHAQSPRLGQPTAVESPGVALVTLETLPEVAWRGQIVYALDIDEFRVFDGVAWQNPTAAPFEGTQTFVGPAEPVADNPGDLWMNTDTYQMSVWNGTDWIAVVDPIAELAQTAATQALANAATALGLIGGKTTIWYLPTTPVAPDQVITTGDYWLNQVNNKLYRYDGTSWPEVQDADIAAALNQAGTAQSTADQKIITYTTLYADRPLDLDALNIGDVLFAVDQGNKPYRWDGSQWVELPQAQQSDMTVSGSLAISGGAVAHVQANATLQLDGSSVAPTVAPSYTQNYDSKTYVFPDAPVGFPTPEVTGCRIDGANLWVAINWYNAARNRCRGSLYKYTYATVGSAAVASYNFSISDYDNILDFAIGTTYIILLQQDVGRGGQYLRRVTKSTMAFDFSVTNALSNDEIFGVLFNDTYVHTVRLEAATDHIVIHRFDVSLNYHDVASSAEHGYESFKGLHYTSPAVSGISGAKFIIGYSGVVGGEQVFTSWTPDFTAGTLTRTDTEQFYSAYTRAETGFMHDGTNFYQLAPKTDVIELAKYTNDTWTVASDGTRWASAAFRSLNTTSGVEIYRTDEGPRVNIAGRKRSRLSITGPPIPPDANPGAEGDPNAVSIYLGKGTTAPARTSMWLQTPELVLGVRTLITEAPSFSGTNPLATSTFPTAGSGKMQSSLLRLDQNPMTLMTGLGFVRVDGIIAPGTIVLMASTVVASGWKACNGQTLNTALYPDLFAVIGYTFGGSGTSYSVPTITAPAANTMYIIRL